METVNRLLCEMGIGQDDINKVELVLAEALNNIVEHACAGCAGQTVCLDMKKGLDRLDCLICDPGHPMPGGIPPMGHAVERNMAIDELPEGGFGWLLIRELSELVRYNRVNDENRLLLTIPVRSPKRHDVAPV